MSQSKPPRSAAPPHRSRRLAAAAATFAAVVGAALAVPGGWASAAQVRPPTHLAAAGPTSSETGFPVWYKDSKNLSTELCLDGTDPLCGFVPGDVPDLGQPTSFPDNFPDEAFYMLAGAGIDLPSGSAILTAGLEAAFNNTTGPVAGDQITFGRIRIRIDAPNAGHFTVTHPYGVDEFAVEAGGDRAINSVEDIGIGSPGDFTGALKSRIDPFLRWDTGLVQGADGSSYLGDPQEEHRVTGSALGTNYFRIEGPNIGGPGVNVVTTDLFSLMGKVATNAGVAPQSTTYTRTGPTGGVIDVFAASQSEQSIEVSGPGVATTKLQGDSEGRYFGRVAYTGSTPPASVKVTNTSDRPRTTVDSAVADRVVVTQAAYDADARTLTVRATSSDTGQPPALTAVGFGALDATGSRTFSLGTTGVAPPTVTVTSAGAGSDTAPVLVTGSALAPEGVVAQAPADLLVQQGQPVVLDGSASLNATSYQWTQLSGPAVTIVDAGKAVASFTAPDGGQTLTFRLTAAGAGGSATADTTVTVAGIAPPIASAGVPQSVLQGAEVTLDGTGSQGTSEYAWRQTGGTAATLTGADTAEPTFTMPRTDSPLLFELTVKGPGGTDVSTVQVSPRPDVLTVQSAQLRTGKGEWRITGTATITDNNQITVWVGNGVGGSRTKVGTATVDALGEWSLRLANGPAADSTRTISVESTRGGLLLGAPVSVRS